MQAVFISTAGLRVACWGLRSPFQPDFETALAKLDSRNRALPSVYRAVYGGRQCWRHLATEGMLDMSTGWIWTIWAVAMLVVIYLLLTVANFGVLDDVAVLLIMGYAFSAVAVAAQRAYDARTSSS